MKTIPVSQAVGTVLCHDLTQIIPGEFKGRRFAKGHIVTEEDIPVLLSMGKEHLYVWERQEGCLHENEAADRLKDIVAGEGLTISEVKEGKIVFSAAYDGLLKINTDLLLQINLLDEIIISTLHNNFPVKSAQNVAGTRVVPLVIDEEKIIEAERIAGEKKIINVLPYTKRKVGIVTTGSEVFKGIIKDKFGPFLRSKLQSFDCEVLGQKIVPDRQEQIVDAIKSFLDMGAEIIICTGGMSVDPDDLTPSAIKEVGAKVVSYGAPVLPGSTFLLAYKEDTSILGLPGGVIFSPSSVFDLVLPRLLAEDIITKKDIAAAGHGGFCMGCESCVYPRCSFGKGW